MNATATADAEIAHLDEEIVSFSEKYVDDLGLNLPEGLPFEEWAQSGVGLQRLAANFQWLVGDWDRYGDEHWGDDRHQAYDLDIGVEPKTISNWSWVSSRVPRKDRRRDLTWTHHRYAAELDQIGQRRKVLKIAADDHLTSEETRKLVNSMKPDDEDAPDRKKKTTITFTQSFTVYTDDEKVGRIVADIMTETMERELSDRGIEPTKTSRSPS